MKGGQADLEGLSPAAAAAALGDQYERQQDAGSGSSRRSMTTWWALNTRPGAPFANVKLRKAVNWAIDRPAQVRVSGKYGGRRSRPDPARRRCPASSSTTASTPTRERTWPRRRRSRVTSPTFRRSAILTRNSASNVNRGQLMRYELEADRASRRRPRRSRRRSCSARAGNPKSGGYDIARLGWQADYPDPENFINVLFDGADPRRGNRQQHWSFFDSAKPNTLMDKAALMTGEARYGRTGNIDIAMMKEAAPVAPVHQLEQPDRRLVADLELHVQRREHVRRVELARDQVVSTGRSIGS